MSDKPRIGIDVDGVMLDPDIRWREFFREQYRAKRCDHRFVFEDEAATVWLHWPQTCAACFDLCLTSPAVLMRHVPRPHVRSVLTRHFRDFDFFCISHRSIEQLDAVTQQRVQTMTQSWLASFDLEALFVDVAFVDDKRAYCEQNGIMLHLDDSPHVIDSLLGSPVTRPVIYSRLYNRGFNDVANPGGEIVHVPGRNVLEILRVA
jgi:hypothetical protein